MQAGLAHLKDAPPPGPKKFRRIFYGTLSRRTKRRAGVEIYPAKSLRILRICDAFASQFYFFTCESKSKRPRRDLNPDHKLSSEFWHLTCQNIRHSEACVLSRLDYRGMKPAFSNTHMHFRSGIFFSFCYFLLYH